MRMSSETRRLAHELLDGAVVLRRVLELGLDVMLVASCRRVSDEDGDLVVLDGRGILLLTQALLSPDVNHLLTESLPDIPRLEDTVDLRLSKAYVASITWRDVILPSLSRFVQYLGYRHHGPEHAITIPPNQVPSALCILEIGADLLDRLKIGKFHGVSTLHPSIFTYL